MEILDKFPRWYALIIFLIMLLLAGIWFFKDLGILPIQHDTFESAFFLIELLLGGTCLLIATHPNSASVEKIDLLDQLLEIVLNTWLKYNGKERLRRGVLEDALQDAVFRVEVKAKPDAAGNVALYRRMKLPIETVRYDSNKGKLLKYISEAIHQTFKQVDGKLLILGASGSGKTVLMLLLAKRLCEEAEKHRKNSPIPVIFNLSSWANNPNQSIESWLAIEMQRQYSVGKKLTKRWVGDNRLIFLLDGLDEVAEAQRKECLDALNAFTTRGRQVVVCCGTVEYENLHDRLMVHNAIELQPLAKEYAREILIQNITQTKTVDAMLSVLQADDNLWEKVNKPLFVNILINTYQSGDRPFPTDNYTSHTPEYKIQHLIIKPYVNRQLLGDKIPNVNTNRWL